jgi:hypothetical protein
MMSEDQWRTRSLCCGAATAVGHAEVARYRTDRKTPESSQSESRLETGFDKIRHLSLIVAQHASTIPSER